ncbi:hypothetical protein [Jiella avicenniae]|uniref:Uncharacterized protein n=1 Tax=Jiella avicenniae TaxID=2907202 RepID=A0A9X1NX52_9HYPH|nr:hypothetical protein [Jiella avicenniae]MCE7027420.1 hypothetical protein [Jiella avicenniae]
MAGFAVSPRVRAGVASLAFTLCPLVSGDFATGRAEATSLALYPDPAGAMTPGELQRTFAGQDLDGYYSADGGAWSEVYRFDGSLSYRDAADQTSGRWSVNGDRFCTTYDDEALQEACFLVRRRSDNCYDFYDTGENFRPTASAAAIRNGADFAARAWRRAEASTCPPIAESLSPGGE